MDRTRLIAVARGDVEPDLVIEGGRVFSAFTREWLDCDIAVADGRIAGLGRFEGGRRHDATGRYVVPGFIDAHMHVESSKLTVAEFARIVLRHGTTAIVCDPHEIANVLGTDGVHWLLDACEGVPLDVFVMASSCVPASRFESPRRPFTLGDMESILHRRRALGIGEMMNFPAVIAGDPGELAKLALADRADGHAPGVTGPDLDAYLAAGISTDHESYGLEEALEKRRRGCWVLIREASNARNLHDLLPLVRRYGPAFTAFCTDDREPDELLRDGHINQMVRVAVEEGIDPADALLLGSLHPALCHGLRDRGALAPGYVADVLVLPDLETFMPDAVFKSGMPVATAARVEPFPVADVPAWVRNTVHPAPLGRSQLRVPSGGGDIRVIGIIPDQLITQSLVLAPTVADGVAIADPARDLAKIAVVERHLATGRVGLGFVTGFGLERGAFATTIAHDAHNIVCVGVSDEDMALCVRRLQEIGGGIVAIEDRRVTAEIALPVAGLMSDRPAEEVVQRLGEVAQAVRALGVRVASPFMTLSFLALSVIPALKITDHGLVDVERVAIVPIEV
jgi:adenine deaminase